jgi:hypothetical protein
MLSELTLAVLGVAIGAVLAGPRRPESPDRSRARQGTIFRFDSVTDIVAFCRNRYQTRQVHCSSRTGELLLYVDCAGGEPFESLIVHFEGEKQYAVLLPDP